MEGRRKNERDETIRDAIITFRIGASAPSMVQRGMQVRKHTFDKVQVFTNCAATKDVPNSVRKGVFALRMELRLNDVSLKDATKVFKEAEFVFHTGPRGADADTKDAESGSSRVDCAVNTGLRGTLAIIQDAINGQRWAGCA